MRDVDSNQRRKGVRGEDWWCVIAPTTKALTALRDRIARLQRVEAAIAHEAINGGDWTLILDRLSPQITSLERALNLQSATR